MLKQALFILLFLTAFLPLKGGINVITGDYFESQTDIEMRELVFNAPSTSERGFLTQQMDFGLLIILIL